MSSSNTSACKLQRFSALAAHPAGHVVHAAGTQGYLNEVDQSYYAGQPVRYHVTNRHVAAYQQPSYHVTGHSSAIYPQQQQQLANQQYYHNQQLAQYYANLQLAAGATRQQLQQYQQLSQQLPQQSAAVYDTSQEEANYDGARTPSVASEDARSGYKKKKKKRKKKKQKVVHITDCHDEHHEACEHEDDQHVISFGDKHDDYHDDHHDYHDDHHDYHHDYHDDHHDYHDDHHDYHDYDHHHDDHKGYDIKKPKIVIIKKIISRSTTTVPTTG